MSGDRRKGPRLTLAAAPAAHTFPSQHSSLSSSLGRAGWYNTRDPGRHRAIQHTPPRHFPAFLQDLLTSHHHRPSTVGTSAGPCRRLPGCRRCCCCCCRILLISAHDFFILIFIRRRSLGLSLFVADWTLWSSVEDWTSGRAVRLSPLRLLLSLEWSDGVKNGRGE